jgi:hypothetical protein
VNPSRLHQASGQPIGVRYEVAPFANGSRQRSARRWKLRGNVTRDAGALGAAEASHSERHRNQAQREILNHAVPSGPLNAGPTKAIIPGVTLAREVSARLASRYRRAALCPAAVRGHTVSLRRAFFRKP